MNYPILFSIRINGVAITIPVYTLHSIKCLYNITQNEKKMPIFTLHLHSIVHGLDTTAKQHTQILKTLHLRAARINFTLASQIYSLRCKDKQLN